MTTLKNRVALITGVSRRNGIGFGIANRLASSGADLFLHSFSPYDKMMSLQIENNETELIKKTLCGYDVSVELMEADFYEQDSPAKIMTAAVQKFNHIDILVLNHTYDTLKKLDELTAEEIDRHLVVNIRAALLLVQEFVIQYRGKNTGRIVMLTSGQHLGPMPDLAYVASKGAIHQLTLSLSDILIEKGITVNTVNPGPTKTYDPSPEIDEAVLQRMPLGRWGEPDDAARLIAWLVSDEGYWITGQVINSEGGFQR